MSAACCTRLACNADRSLGSTADWRPGIVARVAAAGVVAARVAASVAHGAVAGGDGGCSSAAGCTAVAVPPDVAGPADVAGAGSVDVAVLQCGFVGSILARKTTGNL